MAWNDMTPEEARRRMIRRMRLDADDGEEGEEETRESEGGESGGSEKPHYGNTRLPFGLCKRFGIDLPADAKPRDAWAAIEKGTGYTHDEIMDTVKKVGDTKGLKAKKETASVGGTSANGTFGGKTSPSGDTEPKYKALKNPRILRGIGAKEHKHFDSPEDAQEYLGKELDREVVYTKVPCMTTENANKFNDALLTVVDALGIRPSWVGYKQRPGALMTMGACFDNKADNVFGIGNLISLTFEDSTGDDPTKWKEYNEKNIERWQKRIDDLEKQNVHGWNDDDIKKAKTKLNRYIRSAQYRAHTMGTPDPEDQMAAAVFHEMGHALLFKVEEGHGLKDSVSHPYKDYSKVKINRNYLPLVKDAWARATKTVNGQKDIYKISEYGSTDEDEFFAECFSGYMLGVELPDYCEEMIESVISDLGELREKGFDDATGKWNNKENK